MYWSQFTHQCIAMVHFPKKIMGQFFCIKFSGLKMCACKKNDKYQVCCYCHHDQSHRHFRTAMKTDLSVEDWCLRNFVEWQKKVRVLQVWKCWFKGNTRWLTFLSKTWATFSLLLQPPVWKAQTGKAEERAIWEGTLLRGEFLPRQCWPWWPL